MLTERLPLPLSAIILCGGTSSRMGVEKAFLPYAGKTLIEHRLETLQPYFNEVFLVTNAPEHFNHVSANVVKDIIPGRGPLVGILSGLLVSVCDHAFVTPCDMPLLDEHVILSLAQKRQEADVLLYRYHEHIEPLVGVYSKRCIPHLEKLVFEGETRGSDFLGGLKRKTIDFGRQHTVLPPHFSVDTPGDFGRLAKVSSRHMV